MEEIEFTFKLDKGSTNDFVEIITKLSRDGIFGLAGVSTDTELLEVLSSIDPTVTAAN